MANDRDRYQNEEAITSDEEVISRSPEESDDDDLEDVEEVEADEDEVDEE